MPFKATVAPQHAAYGGGKESDVKGMLLGRRYGDGARPGGQKKRNSGKWIATAAVALLAIVGLTYGAVKMFGGDGGSDAEAAPAVAADDQPAAQSAYGGDITRGASVINTTAGTGYGTSSGSPATAATNPAAATAATDPAAVDSGRSGNATPAATRPAATVSLPADGTPDEKAAILLAEAERLESQGRLLEARATYSAALAGAGGYRQRTDIAVKLARVSEATLLTPRRFEGDELASEYLVKSGDNLTAIGNRYKIPYQLIQRINRMSSDRINLNQKLKVVHGPFHVKILKSEFVLEVWRGDLLVKRFPVGIGPDDTTPAGQYKVLDKVIDPAFNPPPSQQGTMQPKAGGAPDNPIGTRWIKFAEHLGIHGTIEPESIGRTASLGCIRMLNKDVEYVYDFLIRGSQVEIID